MPEQQEQQRLNVPRQIDPTLPLEEQVQQQNEAYNELFRRMVKVENMALEHEAILNG